MFVFSKMGRKIFPCRLLNFHCMFRLFSNSTTIQQWEKAAAAVKGIFKFLMKALELAWNMEDSLCHRKPFVYKVWKWLYLLTVPGSCSQGAVTLSYQHRKASKQVCKNTCSSEQFGSAVIAVWGNIFLQVEGWFYHPPAQRSALVTQTVCYQEGKR